MTKRVINTEKSKKIFLPIAIVTMVLIVVPGLSDWFGFSKEWFTRLFALQALGVGLVMGMNIIQIYCSEPSKSKIE